MLKSESYLLPLQLVHLGELDGTQKSLDPVSNMMLKCWRGVPMETLPAHNKSFAMLVSRSDWRFSRRCEAAAALVFGMLE